MFYLACTRFSDLTYTENNNYRIKHNENVIYGSPLKIRDIYPCGAFMFIAEMNNERNRIEGIGLIKNLLVHDKRHKIYENPDYNTYIYRGKYWLSREQINDVDSEILEIFDNILFKKKSHLKRRIGIRVITEKIFINWNYELHILKNKVKNTFLQYFQQHLVKVLELGLDEENEKERDKDKDKEKEEEEYFEIIPKKRKRLHIVKNIEI